MTPQEFQTSWLQHFPEASPVSHTFRLVYPHRWVRIHSLPDAQRYPHNQKDWDILFHRQQTALTHLFGDQSPICLVTGHYRYDGITREWTDDATRIFSTFSFQTLPAIDLHSINRDQYDPSDQFIPAYTSVNWPNVISKDLLEAIATDQAWAFFLSFDLATIAAPYDGGMDIILPDTASRDTFRQTFSEWLSPYEEGL